MDRSLLVLLVGVLAINSHKSIGQEPVTDRLGKTFKVSEKKEPLVYVPFSLVIDGAAIPIGLAMDVHSDKIRRENFESVIKRERATYYDAHPHPTKSPTLNQLMRSDTVLQDRVLSYNSELEDIRLSVKRTFLAHLEAIEKGIENTPTSPPYAYVEFDAYYKKLHELKAWITNAKQTLSQITDLAALPPAPENLLREIDELFEKIPGDTFKKTKLFGPVPELTSQLSRYERGIQRLMELRGLPSNIFSDLNAQYTRSFVGETPRFDESCVTVKTKASERLYRYGGRTLGVLGAMDLGLKAASAIHDIEAVNSRSFPIIEIPVDAILNIVKSTHERHQASCSGIITEQGQAEKISAPKSTPSDKGSEVKAL